MKLVLNNAFLLLFCKLLLNKLQDCSQKKHLNFEIYLKNTISSLDIKIFAFISYFSIERLQLGARNGEFFFANKM